MLDAAGRDRLSPFGREVGIGVGGVVGCRAAVSGGDGGVGRRAICLAFSQALARYGAPEEVLTDNGKQFTARFDRGGEVTGPTVLMPVEHAGNIFTNDSGERPLTIIQLLELAPDQAP
jgi:hypothetical protein